MFSKRSVFSTLGLTALVAMSSWVSIRSSQEYFGKKTQQVVAENIVTGAKVVQTNRQGKLNYQAYFGKATQYSDQTTRLSDIQAQYYSKKSTNPWHAKADHGHIIDHNRIIILTGHVKVSQHDVHNTQRPLQFTTSSLTLYPKRRYAKTRQWVEFSQPGSSNTTTAKGMKIFLHSKRIELLSQVKSTYQPTTASKMP